MAIVVGFIPTPEGQAALVRGAEEARLRQVPLVVVSSRDPERQKDQTALDRFEAQLEEITSQLTMEGVGCEVRRLDRGRLPSEDLLDVADEVDAALIVIGLRRRSAVGKLIMGSQAQSILLDADRPVLAVKAPR